MKDDKQRALMYMLGHGVLKLFEPQHGLGLSVNFNLEKLETIPAVRAVVIELMMSQLKPRIHEFDVICATPGGCRALPAILAHLLDLPFILPVNVSQCKHTSLFAYGSKRAHEGVPRVLLVHEFLKYSLPVEHMWNVLEAEGMMISRVIVLLDADKGQTLRDFVQTRTSSTASVVCDSLFRMDEVFEMLESDPDVYGLSYEAINRAYQHYLQSSPSLPPKSI